MSLTVKSLHALIRRTKLPPAEAAERYGVSVGHVRRIRAFDSDQAYADAMRARAAKVTRDAKKGAAK